LSEELVQIHHQGVVRVDPGGSQVLGHAVDAKKLVRLGYMAVERGARTCRRCCSAIGDIVELVKVDMLTNLLLGDAVAGLASPTSDPAPVEDQSRRAHTIYVEDGYK